MMIGASAGAGASERPTCFISHPWAKGYHHFAVRLAEALNAEGIDVWLDEIKMTAGGRIGNQIKRGIWDESQVILFVVCAEYFQSAHCREELSLARQKGLPAIGLTMEKCELPRELAQAMLVDFSNPHFFRACMIKLREGIDYALRLLGLVDLAASDDEEEAMAAISLLGRLGECRSVSFLLAIARAAWDEEKIYWLAIALGKISRVCAEAEQDILVYLGELRGSESARIRSGAEAGLELAQSA